MSEAPANNNRLKMQIPHHPATPAPPMGHDVDTVWISVEGSFGPDHLVGMGDYSRTDGDVGWLSSKACPANGLRFRVSPSELFVQIPSVLKLVRGTNATAFSVDTVEEALRLVADTARVTFDDLLEAKVRRLDIGANVPVPRPVGVYTSAIEPPPRWEMRVAKRGSVVVGTKSNEIGVYDKRSQTELRGLPVDSGYGNGPLARVERRFKGKVDRQLGLPVVAGSLLDPEFLDKLGSRLVADVSKVPFRARALPRVVQTTSDLMYGLAVRGLAACGGVPVVMREIDAARAEGDVTTNQGARLRKRVREIQSRERTQDPDDVGREFVDAVRNAVGRQ